jgi:predicted GIY-YIG superfamily endonuclease
MADEIHKKHYWLYALKLEDDKYYVGITARSNPQDRVQQHISGYYGAKWTKKHPPVETLELRDLGIVTTNVAEREEKACTLTYMDKYGYQNVRGGDLSYSGKYVLRFNRFFTEDNWQALTVVVLLMLIILYLTIDKYLLR